MAKRTSTPTAAQATTVKVKLLVSRTNVGEIGDVVEYDTELAARHVALGLAAYVDPPAETDDDDDDDDPNKEPPKE